MSINLVIKLVLTGNNLIYYDMCENSAQPSTKCEFHLQCYFGNY
jgi:hypothetical protein